MNNYERPVFWYSGQFLDPQHFQQMDSHHHNQLAAAFLKKYYRKLPLNCLSVSGESFLYLKPDVTSAAWKQALLEGELAIAVLTDKSKAVLSSESRVIFIKNKEEYI